MLTATYVIVTYVQAYQNICTSININIEWTQAYRYTHIHTYMIHTYIYMYLQKHTMMIYTQKYNGDISNGD